MKLGTNEGHSQTGFNGSTTASFSYFSVFSNTNFTGKKTEGFSRIQTQVVGAVATTTTDLKNCFNGSGVAQLVKQLLLTPEVRGSNPVLSKFYYLLSVNCNEKTQMKKK